MATATMVRACRYIKKKCLIQIFRICCSYILKRMYRFPMLTTSWFSEGNIPNKLQLKISFFRAAIIPTIFRECLQMGEHMLS